MLTKQEVASNALGLLELGFNVRFLKGAVCQTLYRGALLYILGKAVGCCLTWVSKAAMSQALLLLPGSLCFLFHSSSLLAHTSFVHSTFCCSPLSPHTPLFSCTAGCLIPSLCRLPPPFSPAHRSNSTFSSCPHTHIFLVGPHQATDAVNLSSPLPLYCPISRADIINHGTLYRLPFRPPSWAHRVQLGGGVWPNCINSERSLPSEFKGSIPLSGRTVSRMHIGQRRN